MHAYIRSAARRLPAPAWTLVLATSCLLLTVAYAYEDGAPAAHTGGFKETDCRSCHSDNRSNHRHGKLEVSGWPESVQAGELYVITVMLSHPALESGGLQLSVRGDNGDNAGKLQSDDPTLTVLRHNGVDYLQHGQAKQLANDRTAVSWQFSWQAPNKPGPAIMNIAANAANGDSSALGDFVYVTRIQTATVDATD